MPNAQQILVLTGPTACGKSAVGLELAERLGAEIVSLDSMKVYRGLDVGTAKPTPAERARVAHHLLDLRDPWEDYDTRAFLDDFARAAGEIAARGRRVLLEGGTVLYLRSLLQGLFAGPAADLALRARLEEEAAHSGPEALHRRLAAVDPAAAAAIHPRDLRRIVRALEVHALTGQPISTLQATLTSPPAGIRFRVAALELDREELDARISSRVERIFAAGLVEEVRRIAATPGGFGREAAQALGYKEVLAHFAKEYDAAEAAERTCRATRRFARRQLSWLKRLVAAGDWLRMERGEVPARTAERLARHWGLGGSSTELGP